MGTDLMGSVSRGARTSRTSRGLEKDGCNEIAKPLQPGCKAGLGPRDTTATRLVLAALLALPLQSGVRPSLGGLVNMAEGLGLERLG